MSRPDRIPVLWLLGALLLGALLFWSDRSTRSGKWVADGPPQHEQGRLPVPPGTRPASGEAAPRVSIPPPASFVTEDRGTGRAFEIALNEAVRRDPDGKFLTLRIDPPATLESLPARLREISNRGDVLPVCYEPGQPHTGEFRRIITRDITLRLPPGNEVPSLPAGLILKERPEYAPEFAVVSAADPIAAVAALESLRKRPGVVSAEIQLAAQQTLKAMPNDTLVGSQWHLKYQGQSGAASGSDVNVESAWIYGGNGGVRGAGVRIGIVDDGLQTNHPDLMANVDTVNDKDWNGNDDDPNPGNGDDHGTACAGNAAARGNNGIGVSGTAPEATLVGMRLIAAATTDSQEAEALGYLPQLIQIKSNSWGPSDNGRTLNAPGPLTRASIANAAVTGRGGKGTIIVWAGGNGLQSSDNSNYDGYANDIHTIAVAASDSQLRQANYSEPGANLVVCAPSSGSSPALGITTTDRTGNNGYNKKNSNSGGDYTDTFSGTSSATPTVAGIVALMLEKNPGLGWRDVQEILIASAFKIRPSDSDWINNGAGFHFNHKFGAGRIDAAAAVALAGSWPSLPAATSQSVSMTGGSVAIPENNATGITREFAFTGPGLRVEQVTVTVSITHTYRGDLEIMLTSPSGTSSRLAEKHGDSGDDYPAWTFSSVRNWGENSTGTWILKVADVAAGDTGSLTAATVTVHGSTVPPPNPGPSVAITSPAMNSVYSPGATVDVAVTASDLNADGTPGTVASVQLLDGGVPIATDTTAPFAFVLNPSLGSHSLTAIATDAESKASTSGAVIFTVEDQSPVVTAANLSPAGQAYHDQAVSVIGLIASDPESQELTFDYAWEKSSDAIGWAMTAITTDSIPPGAGNAGYLWRCRITASDGNSSSAPFVTDPVNVLTRPPATAANGDPFSYQSGLVIRATGSPATPALFRFGAAAEVPAGLSIDPGTGMVSGTPSDAAGDYPIVIERYNSLDEMVRQSFTLGLTGLGGYAAWIAGFPGLSDSSPGGDPEGDGMVNIVEYYLGSLPGTSDVGEHLPVLAKDGLELTLTWWHLKSAIDVTGTAEWSEVLGSWQTGGIVTEVIGNTATHEQFRATLELDPADQLKFLHLRVE